MPDYMIVIVTVVLTITVTICCMVGLSEYSRFGWKHKPGILCRMALKWRFCHSKYYEVWCNGPYVPGKDDMYRSEICMTFDRFLADYSRFPNAYDPRDLWVSTYFYIPSRRMIEDSFAIVFKTEADCQRYINWVNYITPRVNQGGPIRSYEEAIRLYSEKE